VKTFDGIDLRYVFDLKIAAGSARRGAESIAVCKIRSILAYVDALLKRARPSRISNCWTRQGMTIVGSGPRLNLSDPFPESCLSFVQSNVAAC
jgi:hypothetical protein